MYNNWWAEPPRNARISDMLPFSRLIDESTIVTKDGEFLCVIAIDGLSYSGKSPNDLDYLEKQRQRLFSRLDDNYMVTIHSIKRLNHNPALDIELDNETFTSVMNKHESLFTTQFEARHFFVIRTKKSGMTANIFSKKKNAEALSEKKYRELHITIKKLLLQIREFNAQLLIHDEKSKTSDLLSFFASLIAGKQTKVYCSAEEFGHYISSIDIEFPFKPGTRTFENFMIYDEGCKQRYSSWLSILEYPETSNALIFNALFRLPFEFHIKQSYLPIDKKIAMKLLADRVKYMVGFTENGALKVQELEELLLLTEAGDITWGNHYFALQIFGDSPIALADKVREAQSTLERFDVMATQETMNLEAMFWSSFPQMEHLDPRGNECVISSQNIADFILFQGSDKGLSRCSFGNMPHTRFKTREGTDYDFVFHHTTKPNTLGHTLLIGGSEAGKTTLTSFIITCCMRYKNFKALLFDRLHGMEIPITMLDGDYTDFNEKISLNPMLLPESNVNKTFLTEWLQMITGKRDDASLDIIKDVIHQNYALDKDHRNLNDLADAFGLKAEGSIREAIDKWLSDGVHGKYFNSSIDGLSFETQFVGFDMSTLLTVPDVLSAVTDYIFHSFQTHIIDNPSPHIVFFDEMVKFLNSPIGNKIPYFLQEIRKLNGVFIGAMQEAKVLIEHEYSNELQANIATLILFPEKNAEREHYVDGLGLTETEFAWIKTPSERQVMIKRKVSGSSTILNVDLSHLDEWMKIFNSSNDEVNRLHQCQREHPDSWKDAFIGISS